MSFFNALRLGSVNSTVIDWNRNKYQRNGKERMKKIDIYWLCVITNGTERKKRFEIYAKNFCSSVDVYVTERNGRKDINGLYVL